MSGLKRFEDFMSWFEDVFILLQVYHYTVGLKVNIHKCIEVDNSFSEIITISPFFITKTNSKPILFIALNLTL